MADHSSLFDHLLRQSKHVKSLAQSSSNSLSFVRPRASCVINAPLDEAWTVIRGWGPFSWLPSVDGRRVLGVLLSGDGDTSVGATRLLRIGEQQLFEKLVAIDDEEHILKWRLISHPDTINPFLASFVNYTCTLHLQAITVGNQTFFDWRGEFFTDSEHAEGMKTTFERWYITAFQSLQNHIEDLQAHRQMMDVQQQQQQQQQARPTQVGSTMGSEPLQRTSSMASSPRLPQGPDSNRTAASEGASQRQLSSALPESVQSVVTSSKSDTLKKKGRAGSLPRSSSHESLHVQMEVLRGAHASLVEQLARQVTLNLPAREPPGMQQKPSLDDGYTEWMAEAQPLVSNLPFGVLAGSNESELSQRLAAFGTDSEAHSSLEVDVHACLPGDVDVSKGSSIMSDGPSHGIIR